MTLIDTHIHLYAEEYESDREILFERATGSGISKFLLPNIDSDSIAGMLRLCEKWKEACHPMFGLHPCSVKADYKIQLESIFSALKNNRQQAIAIGEIGLDFYWDITYKAEQEIAFRTQVAWAVEEDLPVVIHSRNSTDELIALIREINNPRLRGVFHCFSGNTEQAQAIINLGFYLGIGGVATFKNSGMDLVIPTLPLNRLLLETDGPYLAPVPHRGKRNEPAYLNLVAERVAQLKNISLQEIAAITTQNATDLFRI